LARNACIKVTHGCIVLVHFLIEHADTLLDHIVGLFLVPEHHLHKVELTLDEVTGANVFVDVGNFTSFDASVQSLELHFLPFLAGRSGGTTKSLVVGLVSSSRGTLLSTCNLVVEDATLLVDLDHWGSCVVVDDAALLIVVDDSLLLKRIVTRVLSGQSCLVPDCNVWIYDRIGC